MAPATVAGGEPMLDWVFKVVDRLGPVGVGLLIALENLIPPIPSEVILPLAGFRARTGAFHPVAAWVAATAGALAGALILYAVGAWFGHDRLHRLAGKRWFILSSQKDLERGLDLFERHSSWIVAGSRCVPVLRSLISLPAGISRMPLGRFTLLTIAGAGVWNALFIGAGWALADNWHRVEGIVGPIAFAVTVAIVVGVIILSVRRLRER